MSAVGTRSAPPASASGSPGLGPAGAAPGSSTSDEPGGTGPAASHGGRRGPRAFAVGVAGGAAAAVGTARRRGRTPPGRLRLLSIGLIIALAALWAAAGLSTLSRQRAVDTLSRDTGASFVAAQHLHAELSAADATIARAFLAGGVEPGVQREAYQDSIASASGRIVDLALADGPREPLRVLAAQLPVYTGLVERARANNRLGNVVGGAYLRQASELMQATILPAVDRLAASDATGIDRGYSRATRWYHPVLVGVTAVLALGGLVALQVRIFRRTHRLLNPPLIAATVLTAIAAGLTLAAFGVGRDRLVDSRDDGYVPMTVVAQARVLALRTWGDESLSLIARGNGEELDADARTATERLGYDTRGRASGDGVLTAAAALGGPDAAGRAALVPAWERYQQTSIRVRELVDGVGGFQDAVRLALADGTATFTRFDGTAETAFADSRARFEEGLASAADTYRGIALASGIALGLAVLLGLAGLQARINDYR